MKEILLTLINDVEKLASTLAGVQAQLQGKDGRTFAEIAEGQLRKRYENLREKLEQLELP